MENLDVCFTAYGHYFIAEVNLETKKVVKLECWLDQMNQWTNCDMEHTDLEILKVMDVAVAYKLQQQQEVRA